jgi:hypothetical protein
MPAARVSLTSTETGGLHAETQRCVLTPFQVKEFSQHCKADMRLQRQLLTPSTATPQSSPSIPRGWKMRGRFIAHGRKSSTEANDAGKTPAFGHVNDSPFLSNGIEIHTSLWQKVFSEKVRL